MLKINNLHKEYDGFTLDCSLSVPAGRITGLIGQNGAGKSTVFKSVLNLIFPNSGNIEIFGTESLDENKQQRIGTVLAESGFSGYLTISDIRIILKQFYPAFDEKGFTEGCKKFGLPMTKKVNELSTGMKAKLKMLAALTHEADLLLLDEPTAGLDVLAREEVLDMLREYMEEKEDRAILISSHISTDLETLCDDIYMIHEGGIVLHEDTDRLLDSYAILKVSEQEYEKLDKKYLIRRKKEAYGYSCLSDQREFYQENYPDIVINKSGIDDLIMLVIKGEKI